MANITETFTLELNEREAFALKKILGSMNDKELTVRGIYGEDRQLIFDIWDLLPIENEE